MVPLAAWPSPDGNASKSSSADVCEPPGGVRAKIENSSRRHPRKLGVKRFLVVREVAGAISGVACFWATSLEKIIGDVIAIIPFRPRGWMQQSTVPRCAILSVRSTGWHRAVKRREFITLLGGASTEAFIRNLSGLRKVM